jgi:hypothetical protein
MTIDVASPIELAGVTSGQPVQQLGVVVGSPVTVVPPAGGGIPITAYMHIQEIPSTVWTVQHHLGRYPAAVSVFTDDFSVQWTEFGVLHIDTNSLYITADIAISGKALVE